MIIRRQLIMFDMFLFRSGWRNTNNYSALRFRSFGRPIRKARSGAVNQNRVVADNLSANLFGVGKSVNSAMAGFSRPGNANFIFISRMTNIVIHLLIITHILLPMKAQPLQSPTRPQFSSPKAMIGLLLLERQKLFLTKIWPSLTKSLILSGQREPNNRQSLSF